MSVCSARQDNELSSCWCICRVGQGRRYKQPYPWVYPRARNERFDDSKNQRQVFSTSQCNWSDIYGQCWSSSWQHATQCHRLSGLYLCWFAEWQQWQQLLRCFVWIAEIALQKTSALNRQPCMTAVYSKHKEPAFSTQALHNLWT